MASSFLYLAFVRILEVLRLARRESGELAVEVVVLRHEVAVLRRCPARHCGHRTELCSPVLAWNHVRPVARMHERKGADMT
jgi:hypothetical protein